jgi:hypothetical protein
MKKVICAMCAAHLLTMFLPKVGLGQAPAAEVKIVKAAAPKQPNDKGIFKQ